MTKPEVLDHLAVLADPIRARLLLLLERQELTVSELCSVLQLPQSTVSRQLKLLGDQKWLGRRREGTRGYYAMDPASLQPTERRMWLLLREPVAATKAAHEDTARLESVLRLRRSRSQEFFAAEAAGEWDRLRRELFGQRFDALSLLGLLHPRWTVGDLGCGTGLLTQLVAPFVKRVIAIDRSEAMLAAAREHLHGQGNVELRRGELEQLPLAASELDAALVHLVLHHVPEPGQVLREAARVLAPSGLLLVVDMMPHDREEYRQQMGHVWLGFSQEHLERAFESAGLVGARYVPLPAEPQARGPRLFVATAYKPLALGVAPVAPAAAARQLAPRPELET